MATPLTSDAVQHLRRTVLLRDGAGLTDRQLLDAYLGGRDEAALEVLVRRHGPMVWCVCRRLLRNQHDAEDAFQATFLVFVRKAASIAARELLANWLYGVAYQTARKARSNLAKRHAREKQVTEMPEPAVKQETWEDFQPLLDREMSRLPAKYRTVLVLCDLQGKTRKEAACQLGCPEGTVASRLATARTMLAKRLSRHGVTATAGTVAVALSPGAASAALPPFVVSSTIKAATLFAASHTASDVISVKVAALAEGVLKAMLISKLKAVVAVVLVLGLTVTGGAILSYRTAAAPSATPAPAPGKEQVKTPHNEKPAHAVSKRLGMPMLEGSKAGDRKELVPGIAFRWCPAGKFKMGEGDDTVDVELSKGFWLGETEVTQGQWKKLMGTSPWSGRTGVGARASTDTIPPKEGSDYAASYISHDDALSFCKKLTAREQRAGRLPKSWKFSLPTEAQWEYACRAGTKTKFSFGDVSQLDEYAWFGDNVDNVNEPYAHQVGLKKPNGWGLRDMHGNVWEWCNDWYVSKRSGGKDPVGPTTLPPPVPPPPLPDGTPGPPDATSARNRVIRGGSWLDVALGCSSVNRFYCPPDRGGNGVQGFRLAAVPASDPPTAATELAKFQGTWVLISSERNGQVISEEKNPYTLTFTGNKWKVHRGDEVAVKGTVRLVDVTATPRKFDLLKPPRLAPDASVDYGIYEWQGDRLRYCTRNGPVGSGVGVSDLRPRDFTTRDGDGRTVYLWKRAQAPANPRRGG
jgi:RNA polymerase sigma factor (sigma-70 family)